MRSSLLPPSTFTVDSSCSHAACDPFAGTGDGAGATPPGLGLVSLDQLSDAAAHAVLTLSKTKSL